MGFTYTVWPQPTWIKFRTWWQIPPQHQSTPLGGPESASEKFSDHSYFFFCFTIHKKLNKSCSLENFFLFLKKKFSSLKKTTFEMLWSEIWKGGFQLMLILDPKIFFKFLEISILWLPHFYSDWLWPYCVPSVYIFYGIKVYKKSNFLTTYPPPFTFSMV